MRIREEWVLEGLKRTLRDRIVRRHSAFGANRVRVHLSLPENTGILWVQSADAIWANVMGELGMSVLSEITLDGVPCILFILNLFAYGTYRKESA